MSRAVRWRTSTRLRTAAVSGGVEARSADEAARAELADCPAAMRQEGLRIDVWREGDPDGRRSYELAGGRLRRRSSYRDNQRRRGRR